MNATDLAETIWLTRPDMRANLGHLPEADRRYAFLIWCATAGSGEYKAIADQRRRIVEEIRTIGRARPRLSAGALPADPFIEALPLVYPDLAEAFDIRTPTGYHHLFWFTVLDFAGRFACADLLSPQSCAYLNHPAVPPAGRADTPEAPIRFTRLMAYIWARNPAVQAMADIADPRGRAALAWWLIFTGLERYGLTDALLTGDWLEELKAPSAAWPPTYRQPGSPGTAARWPVAARSWIMSQPDLRALIPSPDAGPTAWERLLRRFEETILTERVPRPLVHILSEGEAVRAAAALPSPVPPPVIARDRSGGAAASGVPGVNLFGFPYGEFGLAEDLRTTAEALTGEGIPVTAIDLAPPSETRPGDRRIEHLVTDRPRYPVSLLCLNPTQTMQLMAQLGTDIYGETYKIGYWPWEFSRLPRVWDFARGYVDEIWGISRFVADAYPAEAPFAEQPVRVMPLCVAPPVADPSRIRAVKQRLRLDRPGVFRFFFMYDSRSAPPRKNPSGLIAAFQAAFPDRQDRSVQLVLKTMSGRADPGWLKRVEAQARQDPRIRFINETLERDDLVALLAACDAYVSLHRSEGFGRTMAEALLMGKPVIATNASGNADFMSHPLAIPVPARPVPFTSPDRHYPFADGAFWFEPDLTAAAAAMRRLHAQKGRVPGATPSRIAAGNALFSQKAAGQRYRGRLAEIYAALATAP